MVKQVLELYPSKLAWELVGEISILFPTLNWAELSSIVILLGLKAFGKGFLQTLVLDFMIFGDWISWVTFDFSPWHYKAVSKGSLTFSISLDFVLLYPFCRKLSFSLLREVSLSTEINSSKSSSPSPLVSIFLIILWTWIYSLHKQSDIRTSSSSFGSIVPDLSKSSWSKTFLIFTFWS